MKRFRKIKEGFYSGGEPSNEDLYTLSRNFKVKTVISLDNEIGKKIAPILKTLNIKHIIIPLKKDDPKTIELMNFLKENIKNLVNTSKPAIYVHCKHGRDRTGLFVALYKIQSGWPKNEVIKEAIELKCCEGFDVNTRNMYFNFLIDNDINNVTDDISTRMRQDFDFGNKPPAFEPQQSWAPYIPIREDYIDENDRRELLKDMKRELIEEREESIPSVGSFDNSVGRVGFGPIEIFQGYGQL